MTQFQKIALLVCAIILFILDGFVSYKLGHASGYRAGYNQAVADVKVDTVTVVDTVYKDKPVPEYHYIDKPVYIPIHDTTLVVKNDTTYVVLEREVKGYSDEDYKCEVSGIQPALDWIEVYPKTTIVIKTVTEPAKKPYFGFGATAGLGAVTQNDGVWHYGFGVVAGLTIIF